MKSLFNLFAIILIISFSSCGYESSKTHKTLKAEKDSIQLLKEGLEKDVKEYLAVVNHLDSSIEKIKKEELDHIKQIKTKLGGDVNSLINDNIAKLNAYFQSNKEAKAELQKQLNYSNAKRNEFANRASALSKELTALKADLAQSKELLDEKNLNLTNANGNLVLLKTELETAQTDLEAQKKISETCANELLQAYYIAAPKSELKKQNILRNKAFCKTFILDENFDRSVLTKIDATKNQTIALPKSVSGKVLSAHPRVSYKLEKIDDEKVLRILDAQSFWSITKYLVIR